MHVMGVCKRVIKYSAEALSPERLIFFDLEVLKSGHCHLQENKCDRGLVP